VTGFVPRYECPTKEAAVKPADLDETAVLVRVEDLSGVLSVRSRTEDVDHARSLAERIEQLPPILVHRTTLRVIDGAHRILAARILQRAEVPAYLFDGTDNEAFAEAVRRNVTHGKPLTLLERQKAAESLLGRERAWSDRRIAAVCGLAPTTVGKLRRVVGASPADARRTGRDGRTRVANHRQTRSETTSVAPALPVTPSEPVQRADVSGLLRETSARSQNVELGPPPGNDFERGNQFLITGWLKELLCDGKVDAAVARVPLSYVYDQATQARRCADLLLYFASRLEERAQASKEYLSDEES
jgi:ParB-like chromosome segregation protein Spo0J